jgi:hypothetical protein
VIAKVKRGFKQWVMLGLALVCLIAGLATLWLPIPTGVPLLAFSLFLIVAYSATGRAWVRSTRARRPWLDGKLRWLEKHGGAHIGRVLKTTRPFGCRTAEQRERGELEEQAKPTPASSDARGR